MNRDSDSIPPGTWLVRVGKHSSGYQSLNYKREHLDIHPFANMMIAKDALANYLVCHFYDEKRRKMGCSDLATEILKVLAEFEIKHKQEERKNKLDQLL